MLNFVKLNLTNLLDIKDKVFIIKMECEFCKKVLSSKSTLNTHQRTALYCLKIQCKKVEDIKDKFKCELCGKTFLNNNRYKYHKNICTSNKLCIEENDKLKLRISEIEKMRRRRRRKTRR